MKYLILFSLLFFLFTSCKKVIDLNNKDEEEKIVIEGIVTLGELEHTIKLTKTLKLNDTNTFPFINDAIVTLSDNDGNIQTLINVENGIYKTVNFSCYEGKTYTLEVKYMGKTYNSSSTMPKKINIDTLSYEVFDFAQEPFYYPVPKRLDIANIKNFYSFKVYANNTRVNGIFLQDDKFSDGQEMIEPLYVGEFKSGDSMAVEMFCIDENVYKYFYSLNENGAGTSGAVPANPQSNISGGCLGYFSAQTKDKKAIKIP